MIDRSGGILEESPPQLEDIIGDERLERLFTQDNRCCALQIWILQIQREGEISNKIIYGRVVPYSFHNNRWSSTEDDDFRSLNGCRAQVLRINLYLQSKICCDLIRHLCAGETIEDISARFEIILSRRLKGRVGKTSLPKNKLVYRPVAFLLNRDAIDASSILSPHASAGALSAAIVQSNKVEILSQNGNYDIELTKFIVAELNRETGLDFGASDVVRLGDIELLVFPALDDRERPLLVADWASDKCNFNVQFDPQQLSHSKKFIFNLIIRNDDQISQALTSVVTLNKDGKAYQSFNIPANLQNRVDSTEVDIFVCRGPELRQAQLCCKWRTFYIREITLHSNFTGNSSRVCRRLNMLVA